MKVAVCISGLINNKFVSVEECLERLHKIFPYDFFLSTWTSSPRKDIPDVIVHDEPETVPTGPIRPWSSKQLVAHAHNLKRVPLNYDMIIRTRYDVFVNPKFNFTKYVEDSYEYNTVIGFAGFERQWKCEPRKLPYGFDKDENYWGRAINDHIIMHPRHFFDPDKVIADYPKGLVPSGEKGWWKYLIKEHYGDVGWQLDPCINYTCGVTLERHSLK